MSIKAKQWLLPLTVVFLLLLSAVIAGCTEEKEEKKDSDGDGVYDEEDAFPTDPAASVDEDEDGYPDEWNEGMSRNDSTSDPKLFLDRYPDDPDKWADDTDGDGYPDPQEIAVGTDPENEWDYPGTTYKPLTFWHTFQHSGEKEAIEDAVARFEAAYTDVKVKIEEKPYDGAVDAFTTAAAGGAAPDVFRMPNDRLGSVVIGNYLEPVDNYISAELEARYLPVTLEAMSLDGDTYGLPASYDGLSMIINNDLFTDAELDPTTDYPTTTEELINVTKTLTDDQGTSDDSDDVWGIVFPYQNSFNWFPWQGGFGGEILDENYIPALNSSESVAATEFIMSLRDEHGVLPEGADWGPMDNFFTGQRAGIIINGPWSIKGYQDAGVNLSVVPLPEVSSTGLRMKPTTGVKGYVMSADSEYKDEAFNLMNFLTNEDTTWEFANITKTLPSVVSVYSKPNIQADPIIQGYKQQAEFGQPMPSHPNMGMVWTPLDNALQAVASGEKTAQEALNEAEATILADLESD